MTIRNSFHAALTTLIVAFALPAAAQSGAPNIRSDAQAAFSQPYGLAIVQQFATELQAAGSRSCLQARQMDNAYVTWRARQILTHYAAEMNRIDQVPSRQKILYDILQKRGDTEAIEKLEAAESAPAVQALRRAQPTAVNANLANDVAVFLNRYMQNHRLPMKATLGYLASGDQNMSIMWEKESSLPEELLSLATPQLEVIADLLDRHKTEIDAEYERLSPSTEDFLALFDGIETYLAEMCIPVNS